MMPPDQKSKVSLEDLLSLKKAERPGAEFWTNFERELRQKQLTALVQKRRWWHELPAVFNRRVYMPAGAAAIVAFSLAMVRYSTPLPVAQVENTAPKIAAADPAVEVLPATVVSLPENSQGRYEEPLASASRSEPVLTASAQAGTTDMVGLLPLQPAMQETESPSARSIAANLAKIEQDEPDLAHAVMGSRLSPTARVQTASAVQNDSDADSARKYRLIARYAEHSLSPEPAAPALVRERIARRLGDEITDRISRIGVEGSRVSLKF